MSDQVLLVGAGRMGIAYTRVLATLQRSPVTVCRSPATAATYLAETGVSATHGGLAAFLSRARAVADQAIVAVGVEHLAQVTAALVRRGVRRVLVEKPGGLDHSQLARVAEAAARASAEVFVAYNRRFLASSREVAQRIAADGGVTSLVFDFTERRRLVESAGHAPEVLAAWLLANSSHVIDLAFHLAGPPQTLRPQVRGSLPWHPQGARFSGHGTTRDGGAFAYLADWEAPGGWSVDLRTRARRLVLSPLETLKEQREGHQEPHPVDLDDDLDRRFKPGLFLQTLAFLTGQGAEALLTVGQQIERVLTVYEPIARGGDSAGTLPRWLP